MSEPIPEVRAQAGFLVLIGDKGQPVLVSADVVPGLVVERQVDRATIKSACAALIDALTMDEVVERIVGAFRPVPEPSLADRLHERLKAHREASEGTPDGAPEEPTDAD